MDYILTFTVSSASVTKHLLGASPAPHHPSPPALSDLITDCSLPTNYTNHVLTPGPLHLLFPSLVKLLSHFLPAFAHMILLCEAFPGLVAFLPCPILHQFLSLFNLHHHLTYYIFYLFAVIFPQQNESSW